MGLFVNPGGRGLAFLQAFEDDLAGFKKNLSSVASCRIYFFGWRDGERKQTAVTIRIGSPKIS